jgi:hypothetical protein
MSGSIGQKREQGPALQTGPLALAFYAQTDPLTTWDHGAILAGQFVDPD